MRREEENSLFPFESFCFHLYSEEIILITNASAALPHVPGASLSTSHTLTQSVLRRALQSRSVTSFSTELATGHRELQ